MKNTKETITCWLKRLDGSDEIRTMFKYQETIPIRLQWKDVVGAFAGFTKNGKLKYIEVNQ